MISQQLQTNPKKLFPVPNKYKDIKVSNWILFITFTHGGVHIALSILKSLDFNYNMVLL